MGMPRWWMTMLLSCCALATLVIAGCWSDLCVTRHSMWFDGVRRTFLLHVPVSYSEETAWPLVIALHPFGGTGQGMRQITGFDRIADEEGFVVCYPEGVTFLWNADPADEDTKQLVENADDVGFLSALVDLLIAEHNVDAQRVYVTGASNGGLMAHRLACELADKVAAVAPVMTTLPVGFPDRLQPAHPVPILMIQGVDDPFFPWEGGTVQQGPFRQTLYLSVADTVRFWVENNRAQEPPEVEVLPDLDRDDGTRVFRETYLAGESGAEVVFYRVEGGGHTWPGGTLGVLEALIGVGNVSRDFSASRTIWEFFEGH